ncbi:hypothetical protein [Pontibacter anaerobius]|uniref:Uncharacterized protein n=1 Tax=Pontibacter anaerobius TaxID=2993940 RepID=A0ABT3RCW2_9BACT|nr:hypothetical protein [Pontibacter anaerobius]MCX2739682.1 hypothetical protein [Pontibacter anaerobius]
MRTRKSAAERFRTRMSGTAVATSIKVWPKYKVWLQLSYKRNTIKGHKSGDLRQKGKTTLTYLLRASQELGTRRGQKKQKRRSFSGAALFINKYTSMLKLWQR